MSQSNAILEGDLLSILPTLPDNHYDAVLSDPPYHLTQNSRGGSGRKGKSGTLSGRLALGTAKGFMGQIWDGGDVAFRPETWEAVMRVMKPGAYLMAFGGSRTFHRLAVALEDAGFILVDTLMWVYGSGFPKSTNISKAIDKKKGNRRETIGVRKHPTLKNPELLEEPAHAAHGGNGWRREWELTAPACPDSKTWTGYGTALKPAYEPILLCRKPGEKTYAANALKWGCGALNIDGCRIQSEPPHHNYGRTSGSGAWAGKSDIPFITPDSGRWPANVLFDEAGAKILDAQAAAGRFFYVTKVSTRERQAGMGDLVNDHPTMKPIDLTRQLATLLLPPARHEGEQRRLLVPFSGAGSEMIGALLAGWDVVTGVEQSAEYAGIARERLAWWMGENLMEHARSCP